MEYTPSIPLDFPAGQQQQDKIQSLEGSVFFEPVQASLLECEDSLSTAQDSQTAEQNWRYRTCTLEVRDCIKLSTTDMLIIYANQHPSWWKLHNPSAGQYTIIMVCWPDSDKVEFPADMIIHHTVNVSNLQKYTTDWVSEEPPPSKVQTAR